MFENILPSVNLNYIKNTGGLTLGQVCTLCDLQPSTIQNWVKRGNVPHPINKMYFERHISRILLIKVLRDSMNIDDIGELMHLINGDTDDESDDIISESQLYDLFYFAVANLDEINLSDDDIDKTINKALKSIEVKNIKKVKLALKIMVYSFISGLCLKNISTNLSMLKKEK